MEMLALRQGDGAVMWLHGAEAQPPVRATLRAAPGWAGEEREERLGIILEGMPEQLRAWVAEVERLLLHAARWAREGAGQPVRLCIVPYAGSEEYSSLVTGGQISLPPGGLAGGRAQVEVRLRRVDAWESSEEALAAANPGGVDGGEGLLLMNHCDGQHCNYAAVTGGQVRGSLPGLVRLNAAYTNGLGDLTTALVTGGEDGSPGRGGVVLEAEAAEGETGIVAPEASGGQYVRRVVSPFPASALLTWHLSSDDLLAWEPGEMIPFARFLAAPGPYADAVVFWQVTSQGVTWESARLPLGSALLQELPAVDLFAGLRGGRFAPLALALMLKGPGIYEASIDFVQFFPAGRVRRYLARGGLQGGGVLEDDCGAVAATPEGGGARLASHCAVGQPLALEPGRDQRLYVLHAGGSLDELRVRLWYRPRWREV